MIELTVADVSTDSAPTVAPETPAAEAARVLHDPAVPALVVCEEDDVVGIVTDSYFVTLVAEDRDDCAVEAVMSSPVVTTSPTAPIAAAAERMREAGVGRLPVVEDGAYRGIVSASTLAPYLPPTASRSTGAANRCVPRRPGGPMPANAARWKRRRVRSRLGGRATDARCPPSVRR